MSIDTDAEPVVPETDVQHGGYDHGHDHGGGDGEGGGHHESPEVIDGRQRLAIWLFIGGDIVILAALLFTYLYLRGTDTDGHWMSMLGYTGHPWSYYNNILFVKGASLPNPTIVKVGTVSAGFYWLITLVTVVSAGILWGAERRLRQTRDAKGFTSMAGLTTLVALLAIVLTIIQLRQIPEIFQTFNDSAYMAYTGYDSAIMLLEGSALVHLCILGFLGLGLTIRTSRGAISGEKWYQVRLVRMFWVWVAVSSVITTLVVTTINTIH
jgi:heme/copper-type cytochrome/quinol oxidase subunit 3